MDCTVWNERHRTRLAFCRPGAGAHRDIERGKLPSATTAVSPFLYCFTMSWWVGGSLRTCSVLFFGLGAGAAAAHKISTEAERGTGYCFFLLPFCPLHCDASVMVVDCAAVKTGCMLEKYIPAKGCNKGRVHLYFLVEVLLMLPLRAAAAAHNISTEAEVLLFLFWWLRCCCSSLIERVVLKTIRLVSAFCLIRVRN